MTPTDTTADDGITELHHLADQIFTTCDGLPYEDVVAVLTKAQGPLISVVTKKGAK